jgi:hypothetical protein
VSLEITVEGCRLGFRLVEKEIVKQLHEEPHLHYNQDLNVADFLRVVLIRLHRLQVRLGVNHHHVSICDETGCDQFIVYPLKHFLTLGYGIDTVKYSLRVFLAYEGFDTFSLTRATPARDIVASWGVGNRYSSIGKRYVKAVTSEVWYD